MDRLSNQRVKQSHVRSCPFITQTVSFIEFKVSSQRGSANVDVALGYRHCSIYHFPLVCLNYLAIIGDCRAFNVHEL